jgi:predicted HTH transcriptional regulator
MLMNQEKTQALQKHIQAIANILYEETSSEQLKNLEILEETVRQQILEHVSPQIGVFLSKKQRELIQVDQGN